MVMNFIYSDLNSSLRWRRWYKSWWLWIIKVRFSSSATSAFSFHTKNNCYYDSDTNKDWQNNSENNYTPGKANCCTIVARIPIITTVIIVIAIISIAVVIVVIWVWVRVRSTIRIRIRRTIRIRRSGRIGSS